MAATQEIFESEDQCGVDCMPIGVGKNYTVWVKRKDKVSSSSPSVTVDTKPEKSDSNTIQTNHATGKAGTNRQQGVDILSKVPKIKDLGFVPSYTGEFPSPLPLMWYAPTDRELQEAIEKNNDKIPATKIRSWVRDASEYHEIPHVLLAALLQNENPIREKGIKGYFHNIAQFIERSGTTFLQIIDEEAGDIVPDKIGDTRIASGSSGIANLTRENLRVAIKYTVKTYNKNIIPDNVRYRNSGYDSYTKIPGDDLKNDLYYTAAYVRRLLDIVTTNKYNPSEGITMDQAEKVLTLYNGPLNRSEAMAYGKRAINHILQAKEGTSNLYFYEK